MSCESIAMAVAVLYGPVDDVISQKEVAGQKLLFSKEDAIEMATSAVRAHLEEKLCEGNAFKVYMAVEKDNGLNGDNILEEFNDEET